MPAPDVDSLVAELRALGSEKDRAGMARFGINASRAFGISMATLAPIARKYRRQHELALALWDSGHHEARLLAVLIDDPKLVTAKQMDTWVAGIDSWDLCDQACMKLFNRTALVTRKIDKWAADKREFVRRAAFALIVGYAIHGKRVPDADFLPYLELVEKHATDQRNFVRKAVNWALRTLGKRSPALHAPALALARKLAASENTTARWIGKDAVRELTDPAQVARIKARAPVV